MWLEADLRVASVSIGIVKIGGRLPPIFQSALVAQWPGAPTGQY